MFGSIREYLKLRDEVDKLEARTVELARQLRDLNSENAVLYRENKELRYEKQEIIDVLKTISKRATSNACGNERVILNKINELSIKTANQYR